MGYYRDYSKFNKRNSFGTIFSEKNKRFPWYLKAVDAKQRCNNPNDPSYKSYGGRGIRFFLTVTEVKKLWFRDRAYLMKVPSIDRKDNDGNYTYENCKFIELIENIKKAHRDRKTRYLLSF